ncbi:MAG: acyl-CoA dehydrogenase family protein [Pseudomonadota bacterium]
MVARLESNPNAPGNDPVSAARALRPEIEAMRAIIDAEQAFPEPIVDAMRGAQLFQLSLPANLGGPENHPLVSFEAIEALASADGSVGWCASISTSTSLFVGGWLEPEIATTLFGTPPDARMSGSVRAEGRADIVNHGFRVTGRWDFASNINQARWLFCSCKLWKNGEPLLTPNGMPRVRTMLIPRDRVELIPTWDVVGMRATGSHDFAVNDAFVPDAHSLSLAEAPKQAGHLYHPRFAMSAAWTTTAAVALGIGRGAIDNFRALAESTNSTGARDSLLRDRPRVQGLAGEAEAIINSARAFLVNAIGTAWDSLETDADDPGPQIAQARLAITHAMHESIRAVDKLFRAAGTNAVYEKNGIERWFRDVHVAAQHAAGQPTHYETAGKTILGISLREPGW